MATKQQPIHEYYARGEEQGRLDAAVGQLELLRTQELLLRHLPAAPARVADIGGGPGRYSLWLAAAGHRVVHRDLVPLHIEQLRREDSDASIETAVADARQLDIPDMSVDATLLLGPLYHLEHRAERLAALHEARRITRSGGPVFVGAISRWAPRLDGILRLRLYREYPQVLSDIARTERSGILPPIHAGAFSAYSHRPAQLAAEIRAAGLELLSLVAIEGLAFALPDLAERLADARDCEVLLDSMRALEAVPELLGIGPHLLAIGRVR